MLIILYSVGHPCSKVDANYLLNLITKADDPYMSDIAEYKKQANVLGTQGNKCLKKMNTPPKHTFPAFPKVADIMSLPL